MLFILYCQILIFMFIIYASLNFLDDFVLMARDLGNLIMPSVHAPVSLSLSFFLPVPPVSFPQFLASFPH